MGAHTAAYDKHRASFSLPSIRQSGRARRSLDLNAPTCVHGPCRPSKLQTSTTWAQWSNDVLALPRLSDSSPPLPRCRV